MDLKQDTIDMMSSYEARCKMLLKNEALRHLLPLYKKTSLLVWSKLDFAVKNGETNIDVDDNIGCQRQGVDFIVKWIINDLQTQGYTVVGGVDGGKYNPDHVVKFLISWI